MTNEEKLRSREEDKKYFEDRIAEIKDGFTIIHHRLGKEPVDCTAMQQEGYEKQLAKIESEIEALKKEIS
jgi:archaellum component FlaC